GLAFLRCPQNTRRVMVDLLVLVQEAEEALERSDCSRLARRRRPPHGLLGEEAAQVQRSYLAYRDESLLREEGHTGADVAFIGRAGERREPPFDAAVVEEVGELLAHFASFRQAEGCCSETRGDTPACRPAVEKAPEMGLFLWLRLAGDSSGSA